MKKEKTEGSNKKEREEAGLELRGGIRVIRSAGVSTL